MCYRQKMKKWWTSIWNLYSFYLLEIIQVLDSIAWVRCASGNVFTRIWSKVLTKHRWESLGGGKRSRKWDNTRWDSEAVGGCSVRYVAMIQYAVISLLKVAPKIANSSQKSLTHGKRLQGRSLFWTNQGLIMASSWILFVTPTVLAGIQVGSGRSGNRLRWLEPGQQLSSRPSGAV